MSCTTVKDGVTWECLQGGTGLEVQKTIVTRCKFVVVSLYNVNDAAHSMARSIII